MTTIKCLLAGLFATGLLTMSAAAHETATTMEYPVMRGAASVASGGDWTYGNARIPASHALSMPRRDEPGGVCDHGDNPMIC